MKVDCLNDSPRLGRRCTLGVGKLYSPVLVTIAVFGSVIADTPSKSSHGRVEKGVSRIRQYGRLVYVVLNGDGLKQSACKGYE